MHIVVERKSIFPESWAEDSVFRLRFYVDSQNKRQYPSNCTVLYCTEYGICRRWWPRPWLWLYTQYISPATVHSLVTTTEENRESQRNPKQSITYVTIHLFLGQMARTAPKHWIVLNDISTPFASLRASHSHEHARIPVFSNHLVILFFVWSEQKRVQWKSSWSSSSAERWIDHKSVVCSGERQWPWKDFQIRNMALERFERHESRFLYSCTNTNWIDAECLWPFSIWMDIIWPFSKSLPDL